MTKLNFNFTPVPDECFNSLLLLDGTAFKLAIYLFSQTIRFDVYEKSFNVSELSTRLSISRPSIYNSLEKLKLIDVFTVKKINNEYNITVKKFYTDCKKNLQQVSNNFTEVSNNFTDDVKKFYKPVKKFYNTPTQDQDIMDTSETLKTIYKTNNNKTIYKTDNMENNFDNEKINNELNKISETEAEILNMLSDIKFSSRTNEAVEQYQARLIYNLNKWRDQGKSLDFIYQAINDSRHNAPDNPAGRFYNIMSGKTHFTYSPEIVSLDQHKRQVAFQDKIKPISQAFNILSTQPGHYQLREFIQILLELMNDISTPDLQLIENIIQTRTKLKGMFPEYGDNKKIREYAHKQPEIRKKNFYDKFNFILESISLTDLKEIIVKGLKDYGKPPKEHVKVFQNPELFADKVLNKIHEIVLQAQEV